MVKKWTILPIILLVSISLVISSLFISTNGEQEKGYANSQQIRQLEREVERLKREQQSAQQEMKQIAEQIRQIERQNVVLFQELTALDYEITATSLNIAQKEEEINETEVLAYQAALELQEAEERLEARDALLKARVRSIYETGGQINYIEVLLGSSSFGEFLERLDFISLLVQQDQKIIEDYIFDKELIIQKKEEIEEYLVQLEGHLVELNRLSEQLLAQEKQKRLSIASNERTQQELAEQEEEMERLAAQLANQAKSKLAEIEKLKFDGKFLWPVPDSYRITSYFGNRIDPFTGVRQGHNGMDIGAPQGTTIVAASGGIVTVAEYVRGYGNTVIIEHGNNIRSLYAHIRNGGIKVRVGQTVKKGDKIAEVGSTGRSTGPHLHFEVHENGAQVDPLKYLRN